MTTGRAAGAALHEMGDALKHEKIVQNIAEIVQNRGAPRVSGTVHTSAGRRYIASINRTQGYISVQLATVR